MKCNHDLRSRGLPYPRTCAECGLGPCHMRINTPPVPPPYEPEPKSELITTPVPAKYKPFMVAWRLEEIANELLLLDPGDHSKGLAMSLRGRATIIRAAADER